MRLTTTFLATAVAFAIAGCATTAAPNDGRTPNATADYYGTLEPFASNAGYLVPTDRFGNGDPIGKDIVDLINGINEANTAREPWQAGDLLLVDNIRTAHSREAYSGPREVLVGMADPVDRADRPPTVA